MAGEILGNWLQQHLESTQQSILNTYQHQLGTHPAQNALYGNELSGKHHEYMLTQKLQEQQHAFTKQAEAEGAVRVEDMNTTAFTEPLSVVKDLWCAAGYGGTWVDVFALAPVYRLMFSRLRNNGMFESVNFVDRVKQTITTMYRLKE